MRRLETAFAGVKLKNPLILASATTGWDGYGCHQAWVNQAAAIVPKTFAPPAKFQHHPRCGRLKIVKVGKTAIGMINNELYTTLTLDEWIDRELAIGTQGGAPIIASIVAQSEPALTAENAKKLEATGKVVMFEINVSCPMPADSSQVGFLMGNNPEMCARQVATLKKAVALPVGIKLTPTTHDMVPMAKAAEAAGADFLTIANSVRSFAGVDIESGLPRLAAYGGYTGPAIKPITQRHVSEVARAVKIPISAVGGVSSWEDVIEYIMIGASTIQICTSIMWKGYEHFQAILRGLTKFMERKGLASLDEIRGQALPHITTIEELAKRPAVVGRVDTDICLNHTKGTCELCGKVCFYQAIEFAPSMAVIEKNCDGCGMCVEICPVSALTLVPAVT
jgi:dihydropyrimidine dehydrogenase (NAD+) subunit PreA